MKKFEKVFKYNAEENCEVLNWLWDEVAGFLDGDYKDHKEGSIVTYKFNDLKEFEEDIIEYSGFDIKSVDEIIDFIGEGICIEDEDYWYNISTKGNIMYIKYIS
jgi:hypothetical protein